MRAVIAVVVLIALGAAPVAAQPKGDVAATFQAGVDAFRLGKYDEARALLERARVMQPDLPGPHRFLAAVAQAEKKWDECVVSAHEAMRLKPDSTEIAATRELHEACRTALGRSAFTGEYGDGGAIAVTANVDGATVSAGGLRYGGTPLAPRALAAGRVDLVVEKPGWKRATITVDVLPAVVTDVAVTLEVDPAAGDGQPIGPDPTTHGWLRLDVRPAEAGATLTIDGGRVALADSIPLEGGVHEVIVDAPGRERWRRRVRITRGQKAAFTVAMPAVGQRASQRRVALYVLAGAGAMAALGVGAAVISSRAAEEARDIHAIEISRPVGAPLDVTGAVEPVRTRDDLEAARSRAKTWSTISLASYGLAIVAGGVGGYLLLRQRTYEAPGRPAPFAVAPVVGPDRVGAVVEVTW